MKKQKLKWIALMLSFGTCSTVLSQTTMTIKVNGVEHEQIPIENLRKLTFPDEKLGIEKTDGSEQLSFPLSEIMLVFDGRENVHNASTASAAGLKIYRQDGVLYILGEQPELGRIQLFDLRGWQIATQYCKASRTSINISGLSSGIYILRIGTEVIKFIK